MYPKILDLGPITVHTYGVMLALAFVAGIWIAGRNARIHGIEPDRIWGLGLVAIAAGEAGSRALLFFSDPPRFSLNPGDILALTALRSPEIALGGPILALAASAIYIRRTRLPAGLTADLAAPGLALGQAIIGLGCLAAGCGYGRPTALPWGITFTSGYAGESVGVPLYVALHPTQIYQSAGALLLFFYLAHRLPQAHGSGRVFLEYLSADGVLRFALGFLRGEQQNIVPGGMLNAGQLFGIIEIAVAFIVYFLLRFPQSEHQQT